MLWRDWMRGTFFPVLSLGVASRLRCPACHRKPRVRDRPWAVHIQAKAIPSETHCRFACYPLFVYFLLLSPWLSITVIQSRFPWILVNMLYDTWILILPKWFVSLWTSSKQKWNVSVLCRSNPDWTCEWFRHSVFPAKPKQTLPWILDCKLLRAPAACSFRRYVWWCMYPMFWNVSLTSLLSPQYSSAIHIKSVIVAS